MHKDTFIFLREHEEKAKTIVDYFLENSVRNNYEGIVCISGISGVGKSEIAWFVSRQLYKLGISSHIVNLDRLYKVNADVRNKWRKEKGYVGHEEMDWKRVERELNLYNKNDIRVLIVEGLYAAYVKGTLKFYIDGNIESSEDFRKLRGKEEQTDFRKWVVEEEYADILRGMRFVDYTI